MFDVDGLLVGYGNMAPELLIQLIAAGKAQDYPRARELHEKLLPLTKAVYHRGSHMEGTVALKHALVARGVLDHATVRPPLLPLAPSAAEEITLALKPAELFCACPSRRARRSPPAFTAVRAGWGRRPRRPHPSP